LATAIPPEEGTVEEQLTVRQVVQVAIAAEARGAELYRELAKKFASQAELGEAFTTLARDEEGHEAHFRALQSKLPAGEQGALVSEQGQYLTALAMAERLFFAGGMIAQPERIKNPKDALERAYALERATLLYYHGMRDTLGRSEALDAIIEEEKRHLVQVMRYLVSGAKIRGLSDPW
jgi:rubrerythrin